ncbi:hypothetical protein HMPREF0742_01860 [Rothia aeria F0184]|uniref:Uncharacterized protein n=1 Tax=Rothia aeria F0184 TaxID=888019 RepID=U7V1L6_9MICC|nr:hypothetical protein HMPREF0742_01860 [Rothia aeria F0184]
MISVTRRGRSSGGRYHRFAGGLAGFTLTFKRAFGPMQTWR